jgi:alpha-methylacyl-CoA racemase
MAERSGPLTSLRIVEVASIGPGPFCAMVLSDLGADVVRVDRAAEAGRIPSSAGALGRGRRSIALDLKHPDAVQALLRLVEGADGLIEGFRPGVAERLGFGPEVCLARNSRLVYGRMTGWGQTGPWAQMAGHDINYIALSGPLGAIGRGGEPPVPPLNLVGDFGGGGMLLAVGMLAALLEARQSGRGQVVDAAMVDGAALLATMIYELAGRGAWSEERGTNLLDGGTPFYEVYRTRDGEYVSFGSLEPQFFALLVQHLELDFDLERQNDRSTWPALRKQIAEKVAGRTRAEWEQRLTGTDVCFAPVLKLSEVPRHPHALARQGFVEVDGLTQPAPAPRFSRTPGRVVRGVARAGEHNDEVLREYGLRAADIERLRASGALKP